ncbi:MAG: carbohydrate ABC transporter permease [Pleomorphochaeta sp.]
MKKKYSLEKRKEAWAYAFLAVPILFYVTIRLYPTINAFYLAFTDWDIVSSDVTFIGLQNFKELFEDTVFFKTLGNTFKYVIIGLPISLLLGFILAYNIDKSTRCGSIFKTVFFMPYITSMVAVAWVWRWFFQPAPVGVFNNILSFIGLPNQEFLRSVSQAPLCIITTTVWADLGFQMIIYLAGIKGISKQYYEAAEIDGANNFQTLVKITLPLLKPTFIFLLITGTIRYLRIFTQVLNMTSQGDGGPLNATKPLVLYIYNTAFNSFRMGYAAAMTVILFLIILIITLIQLRVSKSEI